MKKVKLGNSDMEITRIGFGAWAIGGGDWDWGWGEQDDRQSIDAIYTAVDAGINWIDTAPVYGLGHSETVIGKALKGLTNKPFVFTKCSLVWDESRKVRSLLTQQSVEQEIEDSLRRLQVDVLDLVQIHWPNPEPQLEEGWETLAKLQQAGKIRWIGVSNFSPSQMDRMQAIAPVTSNQPPYSLLARDIEAEVLPYCQENNIGTLVYSPMASGLLSGKMTKERVAGLGDNDWRAQDAKFQEPNLSKNLALAELLKEIGTQYGRTAGEIAIAWTLLNTAVTTAIVGIRRPDQVDGVVHAADVVLSQEDIARINDFISPK